MFNGEKEGNMNIRRKILIPMIALTLGGCIITLVFSIIMVQDKLNNFKRNKVNVAAMVVENQIADLKTRARVAVFGMVNNPDLTKVLANNDVEAIIHHANALKVMTQIDFCNIIDNKGYVITRTHAPTIYGDNISNQPHVQRTTSGQSTQFIGQDAIVRLGAYAGAPVYDSAKNIIGVVSLGFRLDIQDFVYKLKELTGCEISVFLNDERISTTLVDENGAYPIGGNAPKGVSEKVFGGATYVNMMRIFGNNMLAKFIPLYSDDNEVVGMVFIGYDTTETDRKILYFIIVGLLLTLFVLAVCFVIALLISGKIERQLKKARKQNELQLTKLNLMAKATRIGLWDAEIKKDCPVSSSNAFIWSDDFRAMLGYSNETDFPNTLGALFSIMSPDSIEKNNEAFANHLADKTGKTPFDTEHRLLKKNGEYSYFRATGEAIRDKDGNPLHIAGALIDINEAKKAAKAIAKTNERLMLMLDTSPLCTQIWDRNLNLIECNQAGVRLYGFKNKQEYLDRFLEVCSPEFQPDGQYSNEKAAKLVLRAFEEGICVFEWTHRFPADGAPIPAEVTLVRAKYGEEDVVIGYTRDLREYNARLAEIEVTQKKLRVARDAAEVANKAKSAFLANMSHEIRTPANSIIGFAELAQDDNIPSKTKEYLGNILSSAKWLLNIVNDILDISKIESGKMAVEKVPFNLTDIFVQCKEDVMPKVMKKGISLHCYAEPSGRKQLLGDPIRLRQVIMNLLSNAVKFTSVGTIKLSMSVKTFSDNSVTMRFEVKDSGIGMTSEQIAKIYEPFAQADNSITRKFGGTGLGLTITKNILELMGSMLEVESTIGVGSKFGFELTFDLVDDVPVLSSESIVGESTERPNFEGEVLICEDNPLNQEVICTHLARVGLKTVVANNGKEGIKILEKRMRNKEKPFALIFMDIHMSEMDGLEAASKILGMGVKTPIIAATANVMYQDVEIYKKNGMSDCLGKPFTSQELWNCLIKYIPVVSYSPIDKSRKAVEDEKMNRSLKINFAKDNLSVIANITQALDIGDIKTAHRLAHTLKSTAGQIGEKSLRAAAAKVEAEISKGKSAPSKERIGVLESELNSVLDKLAPLLAEAEARSIDKTTDAEKVREIIEKLEPMLKNKNPECEDLLDDIRSIPNSEELVSHIEMFNFKKATEEFLKIKEVWTKE